MIRETGWNTVSHAPSCKGRRKSRLVLSWDNAIQSMGSTGWKPTRNMAHEAGCFTIYTHQGIMFCRRRSEHNIGNSVGIPFSYQGTCLSWDKNIPEHRAPFKGIIMLEARCFIRSYNRSYMSTKNIQEGGVTRTVAPA